MHPEKIIYETDTKLGHYQVVDMIYVGRAARVLFSGMRGSAQSAIPRDGDPSMLFDYNRRFLELVDSLKPKSLLVIGGGAFTLPMQVLQTFPDVQVNVIEYDSDLVQIAKKYFGLREHENLNIIISGGREHLTTDSKRYDLILIDAFSGNKIPRELATQEFVSLLSSRLEKNGVCAANIISSYHNPNNSVMKEQFATYSSVFKHVDIFPADNTITFWVSQNFILIATDKRRQPKYNLRFGSLQPPIVKDINILKD